MVAIYNADAVHFQDDANKENKNLFTSDGLQASYKDLDQIFDNSDDTSGDETVRLVSVACFVTNLLFLTVFQHHRHLLHRLVPFSIYRHHHYNNTAVVS